MVFGSMGVVYFNYYFWIPKYLIRKKKHWFYTISIFAIIFSNAWLVIAILQLFLRRHDFYFWERVFTLAVDTTVLVAFTTAFKFILQWHERNNYAVSLEKKNLEGELEMLKSQINPHFIFNTLNTIYFLLEQKEDERAKEALLKFSDTLSHQLYDYNKNQIELDKEVEYLKNYIETSAPSKRRRSARLALPIARKVRRLLYRSDAANTLCGECLQARLQLSGLQSGHTAERREWSLGLSHQKYHQSQ